MKKIINLFLVVCLMASMLCVSALAEGEYTGPTTHSYPTLIDFNGEAATTNNDGKNYNNATATPINFYNMDGVIKAYGTKNEEVELRVWGNQNVESFAAIKFNNFEYDETAVDKQPKKLVISLDVNYINIDSDQAIKDDALDTRFNDMSPNGQHFSFGYNESMSVYGGETAFADNGFFRWSFETDPATGLIVNTKYNKNQVLSATELNNQAFRTNIQNGNDIKYTFVFDLTRDEDGKGNTIVYVDDEKSSALPSYEANVEKINTFVLSANRYKKFAFDNVRIYTIDNDKIAVTGTDLASTTDVPLTTDEVTVNFSHEITSAADKYIIVKKGSETLIPGTDYTIEHVVSETDAHTAKTFKVKFNEDLSYGTTYTIGGSADYFGIDGYALEEETTFASFTTETAPQINLSSISVKKGFYGNVEVTDLSDALGSSVSVTTTASNGEASGTATGTVFFGVYKNDILVNLAFVKKTFAEGESDEIKVNLDLPAASGSDVIEIKAFACEGLGNLDAYSTVQSMSTAD